MMSNQTSRRILCVWLPYWATTRLRHARTRHGAPPDERLATVEAVRGVRRLVGVCKLAEAAGLHPGQSLTQARALCPELVVADAEPVEDSTALSALAHWTTRYTPLAAACPADTLWLDIAGCAHLHGSEATLAGRIVERLERWGLDVRWSVAGTTGAAWALAHHGHGSIIPSGQEGAAIATLPIEALRLEPAAAAGLRRLGLKTVAAIARLPRAELAARFGKLPRLRLDQALGDTTEAIAWPQPPPDWTEQRRFLDPILTTEACTAALAHLTQRLCSRLAEKRLGARQCVASFTRLDGSSHDIGIATALPVHDAAYLLKLLAEKLGGLDPGFGIEALTLYAPAIEAVTPQQENAFAGGSAHVQQRLMQLIDALTNRLRPGRLWRIAPRDSHIPEQAAQRLPPLHAGQMQPWQDDPSAPRPIRLLDRPERIATIAALPDDPPSHFTWRGARHLVRAATGPERIAAEWWTSKPGDTRDYYHVEDSDGARYWMFREASAWFLHGLFG